MTSFASRSCWSVGQSWLLPWLSDHSHQANSDVWSTKLKRDCFLAWFIETVWDVRNLHHIHIMILLPLQTHVFTLKRHALINQLWSKSTLVYSSSVCRHQEALWTSTKDMQSCSPIVHHTTLWSLYVQFPTTAVGSSECLADSALYRSWEKPS